MKIVIILSIIVLTIVFFSCSSKEDNPVSTGSKIEIFPGVGAANMNLGETFGKLKQTYGIPDGEYSCIYIINPNPRYRSYRNHRYQFYNSIKAAFEFLIYSSTIDTTDIADTTEINSIWVEAPYNGLTDKSIGIGSSLNDVKAAYGQPPEIVTDMKYRCFTNYYRYALLGIDFYYEVGDTIVTKIIVYY